MIQIKKLPVVLLGLGVVAFALGSAPSISPFQVATQTPGTESIVIVQQPPASGSGPSTPTYQVVTPTPGTGSIVIVQPPASGSGPSIPQYQVVIPGPNPAQSTGVGLGQQLGTPGKPATVYPTPGP